MIISINDKLENFEYYIRAYRGKFVSYGQILKVKEDLEYSLLRGTYQLHNKDLILYYGGEGQIKGFGKKILVRLKRWLETLGIKASITGNKLSAYGSDYIVMEEVILVNHTKVTIIVKLNHQQDNLLSGLDKFGIATSTVIDKISSYTLDYDGVIRSERRRKL